MLSVFCIQHIHAQPDSPVLSPVLSPQIEWKNVFWPPADMYGNPLAQEDSDEDWYYDIIEYKKNGEVAGYVAVGFCGDPNFFNYTLNDAGGTPLDCYSKVSDGYSCQFFTSAEEPYSFFRQLVVFYDLDGNVDAYYRYNFGQVWGVAQDENEDIYLFGEGENPRNLTEAVEVDLIDEPHLGLGQIYYNPTATSHLAFPLNCTTTEEFKPKFNIVKINTSGDVIWNNYYGLTNLTSAHSLRGIAHAGTFSGNTLIAGRYSEMSDTKKKFLVSIDKTTGNLFWKMDFQPTTDGEIFEIVKEGNRYLISGHEMSSPSPGILLKEGFVSLITDDGTEAITSFTNPSFYYTPGDIPTVLDPDNVIVAGEDSRSTSAIFTPGHIYWFLVASDNYASSAAGTAQGVVLQIGLQGGIQAMDAFGEIRAFDLWIGGTPTADGGFALVTTRHTTQYFDTQTTPGLTTPMDMNDPNGPTIGDCLDEAACYPFYDPNSRFWEFMSTCSYVRKYDSNFTLQWDKIWDSAGNPPRTCFPGNLKQQECVYQIVQSSIDRGLVLVGNTSDNLDDCYIVKIANDCGIADFYGKPQDPDLIVDYSDGVYDITASTTWNTPKQILGTVRIKPGVTLNINNTTVEFATGTNRDATIDIEQNGYLKVDGSTLTSGGDCAGFWDGISVWGDTDQHQSYDYTAGLYHQGRVLVTNQSTIENANTAIRNWHSDHWDERGGIISVENSTFLNCNRAIEFMSYQNYSYNNPSVERPDESHIYTTDFIIDNTIPLDLSVQSPKAQITLWKTDRVSIKGSNFTNENTEVTQAEYRGKAIYSVDANYIVEGYCPSPVPIGGCASPTENLFKGWFKAIEATGSAAFRPISVSQSNFDKNMIGVKLDETDYSQIFRNTFNLGNFPFETFANDDDNQVSVSHLGIYTDRVLHFSIEENTFNEAPMATYPGLGVVVKNSYGAENQVYKNTFDNLALGANGWQVNRNTEFEGGVPAGLAGLQFICNENTGNIVDFEMSRTHVGLPESDTYPVAGIRQNQGSDNPGFPAGNIFSAPDPNPNVYTHFTVNSQFIYRYYYHTYAPDPNEITPNTFVLTYVNGNRNCPSNYTTGPSDNPTVFKTQLLGKKAEYEGILYAYTQLIDDGNTSGTVTDIELTWPDDAWLLHDELMARAPYNSEEVLIAAIERGIMPNAMLLEVLLANPDALQSGKVIDAAKTLLNPSMPQYMIDLLYASRDQTTMRTEMEATLADLHLEMQRLQKKIILSKAFADSTYNGLDSTLYYLQQVKTVEGNYSRAAAMVDRGMYSQAINLLDSMQFNYKLSQWRHTEMDGLKSLYSFVKTIGEDGRSLANLKTSEILSLRNIAENPTTGMAAQKAQNALCFHYGICYDGQGSPKSNSVYPNKPKLGYDELVAKLNTTSAYPNPTDQYITIAYTLLHASEESMLRIYDNLGRQITAIQVGRVYRGQELIDTRKLPNGIYLYQITQNGKKAVNGKFVVTH